MAVTTPETIALFRSVPVVPVVVVEAPEDAVALARALVAGGLPLVEITLRTPGALACIAAVARDVPDAIVGAGSVLGAGHVRDAEAAGARFLVSPGATDALASALAASALPALPGAATASEALRLAERGFSLQKFFPAEASGGVATLKAWAGPLPHLRFCPTGGIDVQRAATYLGLASVVCVGGSWVVPADALGAKAFDRITALARASRALDQARPA